MAAGAAPSSSPAAAAACFWSEVTTKTASILEDITNEHKISALTIYGTAHSDSQYQA